MNLRDFAAERTTSSTGGRVRLRVEVRGAVQGVGFRPFVYRLANELALADWVSCFQNAYLLEQSVTRLIVAGFRVC